MPNLEVYLVFPAALIVAIVRFSSSFCNVNTFARPPTHPTAKIVFSSFSSKVRNKTRVSTPTSLFTMVLEVLARTCRQEKETKRHPDQKRGSKTATISR